MTKTKREANKVMGGSLDTTLNIKDKYDESIVEEIDIFEEVPSLGLIPSLDEIRKAIAKSNFDKAPGPSGITTNAFKN